MSRRVMFDRIRSRKSFRYSRWDGTQRLAALDAEGILDALSDDYLKHGDLRQALERMMQQGFMGRDGTPRMGMQDLLNRLREMRQQQLQRYNMSGVMDDIQQKLEHIKVLEREGIQRRLDGQQPGQPQDARGGQQPTDGQPQAGEQGQQGEQGDAGAEGQAGQTRQEGPQGQQGQQRQPEQQRETGQPARQDPPGEE